MTKHIGLLLLCLILPILACAQESGIEVMRYTYELTYVPDSLNSNHKEKEYFCLDLYQNTSRFASTGYIKKFELMNSNQKDNLALLSSLLPEMKTKFDWVVYKSNNQLNTYETQFFDTYWVEEPLTTPIWTISPIIEKYHDLNVQLAETTFGGRTWKVYFTSDIPINDGPYKFKNLPGFVVKAWDDKGHYQFDFLNNTKVTTIFDEKLIQKELPHKVTKQKLVALKIENEAKPLEAMLPAGITIERVDNGGQLPNKKTKKKGGNSIEL